MPDFAGSLYNNAGVPRDTAADTVAIFTDATEATDSTVGTLPTATALTQTDASGDWSSLAVADGIYDVRITDGSSIRWRRYNDRIQLREIWVGELSVVNQTNAVSNQLLLLRGNNSTRANNDEIYVSMSMEDSAGNETEFARLTTLAVDVTNLSEDGRVEIDTMIAGTLTRTHYFEGRTIVIDQVTGDVTLSFPDPAANVTVTFPSTTDTLVARATTDTLSNKTLVAPALGTPASGVMTNVTGLPTAGLVDQAVTTVKIADTAITQAQVKTKAVVALADAAATLTAAQMVDSGIFTITPTVARTLTTDTAANIIAGISRQQVGTWFDFTIINTAAFDVTLAAGVGVTLSGATVVHSESSSWRCRIDSATAVTIYNLGLTTTATGTGNIVRATSPTLTSPVVNTQLTGTAVGTGASQVAQGSHTHAASGAVTREGGNTTEATTTSTTAVDLLSAATLTIAAAEPLEFRHGGRKTAGAAVKGIVGLKLNATVVGEAVIGVDEDTGYSSTATDRAETGSAWIIAAPRVSSYDAGITGIRVNAIVSTGNNADISTLFRMTKTAFLPTVQITDLVLRGIVGNTLVTLGADELQIYSLTAS